MTAKWNLLCYPFLSAFFWLTLTFTAAAGFTERVQQDWLRQDTAEPEKIFTDTAGNAAEVKMLRKVLDELGSHAGTFTAKLKELQEQNVPANDPQWKKLYFDACTERRKQRLQIVRQTCPVIVYAKHDILGGSHYSYTESPSDAQYRDRKILPGGQIVSLTVNEDGTLTEKVLAEAPKNGTLRDPDVSFDGKTVVFSMRNDIDKDDYHLYDYHIETGNVRQLTFGSGFADIEPCCLPDGDIIFPSTRCMQIVDCWWTDVVNLYCCDKDGRFLRRLTFDQVHTNYPKVLPDGRIIYTRWDYNDRGQIFPHGLFVMNADGTAQTAYYGNNSWFPTSILHARGIPNSKKVVAIASGHHTLQHGKLIVIDRGKGTEENTGVQLIAPVRETKSERIDTYGQKGELFQYPLPLDEENFIVAYNVLPPSGTGGQKGLHYTGWLKGLYYMDADNRKRELLAFDPGTHCGQPVPLQAREVPMQRVSSVDEHQKTGTYYVQDVYTGPGLQGVERGTIKELRITALQYRAAGIGKNSNVDTGKTHTGVNGHFLAGAAMVSTPVSVGNGSWDVKQVLGTVPVEADGSAFFEVPAKTPVYFQLLNERGETVQTMRSWSTLQPGEQQSCFGCHEDKNTTVNNPMTGGSLRTLALRKSPRKPKPVEGVDPQTGFSYGKTIQRILDAKCVQCHTGGQKEDGSPLPFSLLANEAVYPQKADLKRGVLTDDTALRRFSESYMNLTHWGKPDDIVNWAGVQTTPQMLPPYFAGACKSKLLTMFEKGKQSDVHKDVVLTEKERKLFALWIDLAVPFCGSYTEAERWSPQEKAEYAYYQMKRDKMAAIAEENAMRRQQYRNGETELPPVESFPQFTDGGVEQKKEFMEKYLQQRKALPVINRKSGAENIYRNLALNPGSTSGEPASYPYAVSNSEYAGMDCFAACNVIDGKRDNKGHGNRFPSWGPHKRTDLTLTIDFGRLVEIDKAVIWIRADFPHDTAWKSGKIKFSDGSETDIALTKTAEPQTFTFPKRRVRSLTFTDLVQEFPLGWAGFTEVEIWGTDADTGTDEMPETAK
ncbi:MAG: hypothetical protein LBH00_05515 [Planctomycetaceae bacterium]|jgi:hypothetical protein|nr:hypothetical protein [Planctomycetaceae bacterium]